MFNKVRDVHETTYIPWTDGYAIGFRCIRKGQKDVFVYINPSSEDDEGVSNVFVYAGLHGDPRDDQPITYFNLNSVKDNGGSNEEA